MVATDRPAQPESWPALFGPEGLDSDLASALKRQINLDYAATTPPVRAAVDAVLDALPAYGSVHRGGGLRSELTTDAYEQARQGIRVFFNCRDDQLVVFVRNTTEAINLVAASLPAPSRILCSPLEHHANLLPWRSHDVQHLPFTRSAEDLVEVLDRALADANAAGWPFDLFAVCGASNVTGEVLPIDELARVAHAHGTRILVDAAQLAPHRRIDLNLLEVDYLAASGHKLYAPFGSGILVVRREYLQSAPPFLRGGGAVRVVTLEDVAWADLPQRFEAGTPNVLGAVALGAACKALSEFGLDRLETREQKLAEQLWQGLDAIAGCRQLRVWSHESDRLGVATFTLAHRSTREIADHLKHAGIAVRTGLFCAHPLVAHLLGTERQTSDLLRRARAGENVALSGAVRASIGIGVEPPHIARFLEAIASIAPPAVRRLSPVESPRVDVHRHVWPEEFVTALQRRTEAPFLSGEELVTSEGRFPVDLSAHSPDGCVAALDAEALDVAIVSLQPTLGIHALPRAEADALHECFDAGMARLLGRFDGRLRPLAAGRPHESFAGLCVPGRAFDDIDALAPALDRLDALDQLLFVHPGPADRQPAVPSWWAPTVSYTSEMQAAYIRWATEGAQRWPQLQVVFAMLAGGAPFQLERLQSRGIDTRPLTSANVLLETSSYGRLAIELCLAAYGIDRIVYGSDAPVIDPAATRSVIDSLGKTTADALYRTNPARVLAA